MIDLSRYNDDNECLTYSTYLDNIEQGRKACRDSLSHNLSTYWIIEISEAFWTNTLKTKVLTQCLLRLISSSLNTNKYKNDRRNARERS